MTQAPESFPNDPLPANLEGHGVVGVFALLDMVVLERRQAGTYRLIGASPGWIRQFVELQSADALVNLSVAGIFPFLEVFLPEAEELWSSLASGYVQSDIWSQAGIDGREYHLQAAAAVVGKAQLLLIEALEAAFHERRAFIHLAHEKTLQYEQAERRCRELSVANQQMESRNREAEGANRAKSELLARMSGEIRTSLSAIMGMADLLWKTELSSEQRELVRGFRAAGENLLNLSNGVMDISMIESGHFQLAAVPFDLAELLNKTAAAVAFRVQTKGLKLTCRIMPGVPVHLIGDPDRLAQVLLNLLDNSVQVTEKGELALHAECDPGRADEGCLRFALSDAGPGIPEEKRTTIFEGFSPASPSTDRPHGGMGLAICKRLVELMHGRIWVESPADAGSTFYFTARFGLPPDKSVEALTTTPFTELKSLAGG